ncbi:MAG TPA: hydroxymethylglutaryl-CoA lyase, partial [Parasegetibacter sp.]
MTFDFTSMADLQRLYITECPRDAMQGWKSVIPTETKINYLNSLLKVGFDILDCGSFVSAKAIPQMADTKDVLSSIEYTPEGTELLVIIANIRGAEQAAEFKQISYMGFPFSVSPTFQMRNTNSTMNASLETVKTMHRLCKDSGKKSVVYLSMGFGNPYGDEYSPKLVYEWASRLSDLGIDVISLADTVGMADPNLISEVTGYVVNKLPGQAISVHLHATYNDAAAKVKAALDTGCRRIDGAIKGIGGCPMAKDELVGNMPTELI